MPEDAWARWERGGDWNHLVEGTVVPKSLLPAIGYMVVAFSRLDLELDKAIAHLLGAEWTVGRAIATAIQNYRPRVELFHRIIDLKMADESSRTKLHKIATEIESCANSRNRILHDYVSMLTEMETKITFSKKDRIFKRRKGEYGASDVVTGDPSISITKRSTKDLGRKMGDLTFRLQRFNKDDQCWKDGVQFPWRDRPL